VDNTVFNFTRISANLYFGFKKDKDFFIATPEKAFLDALYLMSIGRYNFDIDSIDFGKLNRNEIMGMVKKFPVKTKKLLGTNGYFRKT
jgi:hypothetical protein